MQCLIYPASQLLIDTVYACQLFDSRFAYTLDTTKMGQQCTPPMCSDTRYVFQN